MVLGYSISPIPFYDSLSEQFKNNPTAFGTNYPLLAMMDEPPTFFFFTDDDIDVSHIHNISIVQVGVQSIDVTSRFVGHGLLMADAEAEDGSHNSYIRFSPSDDFAFSFPAVGMYYYVIEVNREDDTPSVYYSELFCVKDDKQNAIRIEYGSPNLLTTPFGIIPLGSLEAGFTLHMWVDALIGKPEYIFEETVTTRMGYEFMENCLTKKTYQFVVMAPEYLCDAMRLIKLCPDRTITQYNKSYHPITFDMSVDWQEQGDLAAVTVTFDTDTVITALGGYDNLHI